MRGNRFLPVVVAVLALRGAPVGADVPVVELVGPVHPVSAEHVVQGIARAEADGAPLVIIRLDTPGGLDTSMRQVIDRILSSKVPVAAFVGPAGARAASAGFLIVIVSDVAAMAPGTNMGAAHPVSAGGGEMDEVMKKKVTEDAAAYIRSKVVQRGRNVDLAEKAVVESRSFTDQEALDGKLIDLVVADVPALLKALDGREVKRFDGTVVKLALAGQQPVTVGMNWRQSILSLIARPEIMFLLLLGALAGIGGEISHPGSIFPGVLGVLCLVLFLFSTQILPINWTGVLLILLAIAMFVAEVKIASYGLLTVGGIVAIILGALMLIDAPIPEMRVPLGAVLPGAAAMAVGTIALVRLVIAAQLRRAVTGVSGLVGQAAMATSDLTPEGWVKVQGEVWQARADAPVTVGEMVTVTAVRGLRLDVRKGG